MPVTEHPGQPGVQFGEVPAWTGEAVAVGRAHDTPAHTGADVLTLSLTPTQILGAAQRDEEKLYRTLGTAGRYGNDGGGVLANGDVGEGLFAGRFDQPELRRALCRFLAGTLPAIPAHSRVDKVDNATAVPLPYNRADLR